MHYFNILSYFLMLKLDNIIFWLLYIYIKKFKRELRKYIWHIFNEKKRVGEKKVLKIKRLKWKKVEEKIKTKSIEEVHKFWFIIR